MEFRFDSHWNSRHKLESTLREMSERESKYYNQTASSLQGVRSQTPIENEIQGGERDDAVRWLLLVSQRMNLNPETFDLSVSLLDRFLFVVRAHPKYLRCITVACLFLAMKCNEEDEAIPSTESFVRVTRCGCSVAEVLRMERIVLNKLDWDLLQYNSPLDFVHIFHALLLLNQTWFDSCSSSVTNRLARYQLSSLAHKLFSCRCNHNLLRFGPSTVALALVSLELGSCTSEWLAATISLQKLTKVDEMDLIRCREVISGILSEASVFDRRRRRPRDLVWHAASFKRKVENEDDVYDDIKRLYGDEGSPKVTTSVATMCGSEVRTITVAALSSPTISAA